MVPPRRKEPHFFDWRWDNGTRGIEDEREAYAAYFHTEELAKDPSFVTIEVIEPNTVPKSDPVQYRT